MKPLQFILLIVFAFSISGQVLAQDEAPPFPEDYRRNVIKWNLTPFLLWDKRNINLSYERVLKPNRSFSVNAGYFVMPSLHLFDTLEFYNTKKKNGFSVSGDYRFYFKKRNKNLAPDGLYWAVYSSIHYYQFSNDIKVIDNPDIQGELFLAGKYGIFAAGVELGYQFVVIKDRMTVDLIFMGPSLSVYSGQMKLSGALDTDLEDEYLEGIRDILFSQVPGLEKLVKEGEVNSNGVSTSLGPGLRYMIQVGYRF
jgi:hypothetical protein